MRLRLSLIMLVLAASSLLADEPFWKEFSNRFATFSLPDSAQPQKPTGAEDTIVKTYSSPDLILTFNSEISTLPADIQLNYDKLVSLWVEQRKQGEWKREIVLPNYQASLSGDDSIPTASDSPLPYYLYLSISPNPSQSFGLHLYFRNISQLGEVEHVLRSMKFSKGVFAAPSGQTPTP